MRTLINPWYTYLNYFLLAFRLNHRIRQPAAELNWSQHVELSPVTNQADKRSLEQRIIRNNLSRRQIRQEVRWVEKKNEPPAHDKTKVILPQPCRQQPLQCYGLVAPDRIARSKGTAIVDCGFNITINTHGTWQMYFTYLTVRIPKRYMRKGYTWINNFWIRDLHENGSRNIGFGIFDLIKLSVFS